MNLVQHNYLDMNEVFRIFLTIHQHLNKIREKISLKTQEKNQNMHNLCRFLTNSIF